MAFIPIPNAIKASIEATFGGQKVVLTLGWEKGGAVTVTDLNDLNDALENWVNTSLKTQIADDVSFTGVTSYDLSSESAPAVYKPFSPAITGAQAGTVHAPNVAAVVGFKTDQRGRSYRGRNYVPGIVDAAFSAPGLLGATFAANLITQYLDLADVTTATNLAHSVLSRFHNGSPRVTGVATPVTSYAIDLNSDSQRRRLPGRGA